MGRYERQCSWHRGLTCFVALFSLLPGSLCLCKAFFFPPCKRRFFITSRHFSEELLLMQAIQSFTWQPHHMPPLPCLCPVRHNNLSHVPFILCCNAIKRIEELVTAFLLNLAYYDTNSMHQILNITAWVGWDECSTGCKLIKDMISDVNLMRNTGIKPFTACSCGNNL